MKHLICASILLTFAFAVGASAQINHADIERPDLYPNSKSAASIKEAIKLAMTLGSAEASLEGRIVALSPTANSFVVEQPKTQRRFKIPLNPQTKLKADKGTQLAGRKTIAFTDFKLGQLVKVTYTVGPRVIEVRLRREKSGTTLTPPVTINEKESRSGQPTKPPL